MKITTLLLTILLTWLFALFAAPAVPVRDAETLSCKQAVLKAIALVAGRGFFRHSIEIQASQQEDTITACFRRPTSDVMTTPGRKPTRKLLKITFKGRNVKMEVLDKEAASKPFNKQYTQMADRQFARAVRAACAHLWKGKNFDTQEFAADVSDNKDGYFVTITYIIRLMHSHPSVCHGTSTLKRDNQEARLQDSCYNGSSKMGGNEYGTDGDTKA
jgi:hypothetical protein